MLQFLQPIWLLASTAIVVPVAIHLWNVRKGKTLKVGSIELIEATAQQRARSLRITERWLLLLRCLLVALLALILAKPYWQSRAEKGWIVVEPSVARAVYDKNRILIDSLAKAGYSVHALETGFPEMDLQSFKTPTDTSSPNPYHDWIAAIDAAVSEGTPVYLFTGNRRDRFAGAKPVVHFPLTWKAVALPDSVAPFIAEAHLGNDDSIHITNGYASSMATTYNRESISLQQPLQGRFTVAVNEGRLQVLAGDGQVVDVDTSVLHITCYAGTNSEDARYLSAALRSVEQVFGRKIVLRNVARIQDIPPRQDWLFWLSDEPVPTGIQARHRVRYAKGPSIASFTSMQMDAGRDRSLFKRIAYADAGGEVMLRDGAGVPLLTALTGEDDTDYVLYTHLDPAWNAWVWDRSFPQAIYDLLYRIPERERSTHDLRAVHPSALAIDRSATAKAKSLAQSATSKAERLFWCVLFVLFAAERWYSFRTPKRMHA